MHVVGLPLHLFTREILKRIGNSCGSFIAIDRETTLKTEVRWVRIKVRFEGRTRPSMIHVKAGARMYEIQAWWELKPWNYRIYSC